MTARRWREINYDAMICELDLACERNGFSTNKIHLILLVEMEIKKTFNKNGRLYIYTNAVKTQHSLLSHAFRER